jgi:hypothetical protein
MEGIQLEDTSVEGKLDRMKSWLEPQRRLFGLAPPEGVPPLLFRCCFLNACDSVPNVITGVKVQTEYEYCLDTPLLRLRPEDRETMLGWTTERKDYVRYSGEYLRDHNITLFACFSHFRHKETKAPLDFNTWFNLESYRMYYLVSPLRGINIMTIKKMEKTWKEVIAGVFVCAKRATPPSSTSTDPSMPVVTKATEWRMVQADPCTPDLLFSEEGSGFGSTTNG